MLYLISGAVAAGKSTGGRLVSRRIDDLVYLEEDSRHVSDTEGRLANLESPDLGYTGVGTIAGREYNVALEKEAHWTEATTGRAWTRSGLVASSGWSSYSLAVRVRDRSHGSGRLTLGRPRQSTLRDEHLGCAAEFLPG